MIELHFASRLGYRRIVIKDRKILVEQNGAFGEVDIDKMLSEGIKDETGLLESIKDLRTDEEMAQDITRDFQDEGWRMTKKNVTG